MTLFTALLIFSYLIALILLWNTWRGADPVAFKLLLTVLVLIPILGPISYAWIRHWPDSNPDRARVGYGRRSYLDAELVARDEGNVPLHKDSTARSNTETVDSHTETNRPKKVKQALFIAGAILVGISLAQFWLMLAVLSMNQQSNRSKEWIVGVDAYALFAILAAVTLAYIMLVWRHWFQSK